MGAFHGSMQHTASGKKKKTNHWKRSGGYKGEFVPMESTGSTYRRETPNYPSAGLGKSTTQSSSLSKEERLQISSQYTVAPAYNKGAYQVIPKENIEHIGR